MDGRLERRRDRLERHQEPSVQHNLIFPASPKPALPLPCERAHLAQSCLLKPSLPPSTQTPGGSRK